MRIDVSVNVTPALQARALAAAPNVIDQEMRKTMAGSVLILEGAIAERSPVGVTGILRGATASAVTGTGISVTGRVWNPTIYGPAVELGSRGHWAPLANILRWARRAIGGRDVNRVARAVWIAIARRGTKAKPFWGPAWKAKQAEVERRNEAMLTRIARRLSGES